MMYFAFSIAFHVMSPLQILKRLIFSYKWTNTQSVRKYFLNLNCKEHFGIKIVGL